MHYHIFDKGNNLHPLYVCYFQYQINHTVIADYPRYGFRGIHLDTARHFVTVPIIRQIIVSMGLKGLEGLYQHNVTTAVQECKHWLYIFGLNIVYFQRKWIRQG